MKQKEDDRNEPGAGVQPKMRKLLQKPRAHGKLKDLDAMVQKELDKALKPDEEGLLSTRMNMC